MTGYKNWLCLIIASIVLFAVSCSSAPKRPTEVRAVRNSGAGQLDLAAATANQGLFDDALFIVETVLRSAIRVDYPPLLIKCAIIRGNILFSMGRYDDAVESWNHGIRVAERDGEASLASEARIFAARGRLLKLGAESSGDKNRELEEIKTLLTREIASLKNDPLIEAAGWAVLGIAEKELRRYAEAESAVRKALAVHEKNFYLEDAAYDWYIIASIYSVSGRHDEAVEALKMAIEFDRRAENGYGLASSWSSLGEVYLLSGNSADANTSFRRSADIYRSLGMEEDALGIEAKLSGGK